MEAALSLGSNLGDRLAHLTRARDGVALLPETQLVAASALYETEPVDVPERYRTDGFLNAVLLIETGLTAERLGREIHALEARLGRQRGPERHAPRPIDIDILYLGDLTRASATLHLPHPAWSSRRFVCEPLAELRPDLILPGETRRVREILAALPATPAVRIAAKQWHGKTLCWPNPSEP